MGAGLDEGLGPVKGQEDVGGDEDKVGEVEQDEEGLAEGGEGGGRGGREGGINQDKDGVQTERG